MLPAWSQTPVPSTATTSKAKIDPEFQRHLDREDANWDDQAGANSKPVEFTFAHLLNGLILTAFVCLLAYLLLGKLLPKFLQMNPALRRSMTATMPQGLVEVIDRLPLDARRSVYVIKVKNECFLVGTTEQSMTMLSKLDLSESEANQDDSESKNGSGLSRFAGLLKKQSSKGTSV